MSVLLLKCSKQWAWICLGNVRIIVHVQSWIEVSIHKVSATGCRLKINCWDAWELFLLYSVMLMKMVSKVLRCRIGKKQLCSLKSIMCLLSSTFCGKTSFWLLLLFSLHTLAGFPSSQNTFSVSYRAVVFFLLEIFIFLAFSPLTFLCFLLSVLLQTKGVRSHFYFSLVSFVAVVF